MRLSEFDFYSYMRLISAFHGNIALCPSETEKKWAELKIGDICALDKITNESAKYSYRPKTCFRWSTCTLSEPQLKLCSKGAIAVVRLMLASGAEHIERGPSALCLE